MDGSPASQPGSFRMQTREPEDLALAARAAWDGDAYRVAPGGFLFEGSRLAVTPSAAVESWRSAGAVRARLRLRRAAVHIAFVRGDELRFRGARVEGDAMAVTARGDLLDVSSRGMAEGLALSLAGWPTAEGDAGIDHSASEAWLTRSGGETVLLPLDAGAVALRAALRARSAPEPSTGSAPSASTIMSMAREALRTALGTADLRAAQPGRRRLALAAAAEELIWARVRAPEPGDTSLDALCEALGTTRRTLQLAFQERFGVNYGLLARAARLQRVRDELRAGRASVSDTAFRLGFEHLGRFAGYYRAFYGENPSVTLRARAR